MRLVVGLGLRLGGVSTVGKVVHKLDEVVDEFLLPGEMDLLLLEEALDLEHEAVVDPPAPLLAGCPHVVLACYMPIDLVATVFLKDGVHTLDITLQSIVLELHLSQVTLNFPGLLLLLLLLLYHLEDSNFLLVEFDLSGQQLTIHLLRPRLPLLLIFLLSLSLLAL